MSITAMRQALEALEPQQEHTRTFKLEAAHALRTAIAEAEKQEPVACVIDGDLYFHHEIDWEDLAYQGSGVELLYTTPPAAQRQWVGLTEKDFSAINQSCLTKLQAATSAESILKEKNT